MRICVFGCSIAWGADDLERGGWVDRFKVYFKNTGKFNEVFNLGVPGDKSVKLLRRMKSECKARLKPRFRTEDVIIVSIGINDARLFKNKELRVPRKVFKSNVEKSANIAKKFVDKVVFVGIIPIDEAKTNPTPWNENSYYRNNIIEDYNGVVESVCKKKKIYFVNVYAKWRKADYISLLHDGLHPNAKGHELLYKQVKEFLKKNGLIG